MDTPVTEVGQILTVKLIPKAAEDLASTRERSKLSQVDIVNRALSLYEFLDKERASGTVLLLRHTDGTVDQMGLI